jgi:hypothetical protein
MCFNDVDYSKVLINNTTISTGDQGGIYLNGNTNSVNISHVYFERNKIDIAVNQTNCFSNASTFHTYTWSNSTSTNGKIICGYNNNDLDESHLFLDLSITNNLTIV